MHSFPLFRSEVFNLDKQGVLETSINFKYMYNLLGRGERKQIQRKKEELKKEEEERLRDGERERKVKREKKSRVLGVERQKVTS